MKINSIYVALLFFFVASFCKAQYTNVSTYSGTGVAGFQNGSNSASKYNYPYGVSFDGNNSIYVADLYNNCIRKIDMLTNIVSTYAGTGVAGYQDGAATTAKFNGPTGVFCKNGKVYVADNLNNRIRVIDGLGNVSTIAGNGVGGFADGSASTASFYQPKSLYVASNGDVYVADYENHRVRRISGGQVTTYAGTGAAGYQNGSALTSQFHRPRDITMDAQGNMYVTDLMNSVIRKITSAGVVSTFAGSGVAGGSDGTGILAQFNIPTGIDIDPNGDFYVTDGIGNKVRKITPSGVVTTIAGNGNTGYVDGSPLIAEFNLMQDLCLDANGNIYIGDRNNNCIRILEKTPCTNNNFTPMSDASFCEGDSLVLNGGAGYSSYLWQGSVASQFFTVHQTGNYTLEVTGNCGVIKDTVFVEETSQLIVSLPNDATFCKNESITATCNLSGVLFSWSTGQTGQKIDLESEGIYVVTAISGSCSDSDTINVSFKNTNENLSFPNIITPNNDGLNDYFSFEKFQMKKIHYGIYNRWGLLVFESDSKFDKWYGKSGNKICDDGTYFVAIEYTMECGFNEVIRKKLFVTLIK